MPTPADCMDYKGPTDWALTRRSQYARMYTSDQHQERCSCVRGLAWDCSLTPKMSSARRSYRLYLGVPPFGPLRFEYAVPITKGPHDVVQQFKFGGGTSF